MSQAWRSPLERRTNEIIGFGTVKSVQAIVNAQICSMVSKCTKKSFDHEVLDGYFELTCHEKQTRNNNYSLKIPRIKLESSKQSFYYEGAKLFNKHEYKREKSPALYEELVSEFHFKFYILAFLMIALS